VASPLPKKQKKDAVLVPPSVFLGQFQEGILDLGGRKGACNTYFKKEGTPPLSPLFIRLFFYLSSSTKNKHNDRHRS
jgi:hypothetical protein